MRSPGVRDFGGVGEGSLAGGVVQAELAARMGTSQSAIARLESGQTLPSTKTLLRYAEANRQQVPRAAISGLTRHSSAFRTWSDRIRTSKRRITCARRYRRSRDG